MKVEWDVKSFLVAALSEPKQFREKVTEGRSSRLVSNKVVTRDHVWEFLLEWHTELHAVNDLLLGQVTGSGKDASDPPKLIVGLSFEAEYLLCQRLQ
jgi:hypothetical protein